jgi:hypothetical protein
MAQLPTAVSVTVLPDMAQLPVAVKLTASPELAVALTVGDVPSAAFGNVPNVIVWLPCVTWKLWLTGVAAGQFVLPACIAWMVQLPTAVSVTVLPDMAQFPIAVKLTASPELAVALTAGDVPNAAFGNVPNVIVWLPCVTWKLWMTGVAAA